MVVTGEHEIDFELVDERLPQGAERGIVTIVGGREYRMVKRDDRPALWVFLQYRAQPRDLLLLQPVGIQGDDTRALIVEPVTRLRELRGAVLRQGELRAPLHAERARGVGVFFVELGKLVVPGRGHDGDRGVDPRGRAVPLAPLAVPVRVVDEIARVERERRARGLAKRLAEDARPVRADVVLRVAEIDERKFFRIATRGAEVEPLAEIHAVAHAVGVERLGCESGELCGVVVRLAEIGRERLGARGHGFAFERAARFVGDGKLRDAAGDRRIRAPGDGLRRRGIAAPREDDAVGQGARRVGEFVGVECGRNVRMALVRREWQREEREEWERVVEAFHGTEGEG